MCLESEAPAQGVAAAERHDGAIAGADALRNRTWLALERHPGFVERQAVEARAVERSKGFRR